MTSTKKGPSGWWGWPSSNSSPTRSPTAFPTSFPTPSPTPFPTPFPTSFPTSAPSSVTMIGPFGDHDTPTAAPTLPATGTSSGSSNSDSSSSSSSSESSIWSSTPVITAGSLCFGLLLAIALLAVALVRRRAARRQADSEESNAGSSGGTGPTDVVPEVPVARVKRRARNAPEAIVVPVAEEQDVTAMLGAPQLRRASSRRAIATPPTDMGMPETQFREELHAYLMSKAPEMQADEVSTFVAKVDTDEQSRAALNEELHQTHGQSLDDFYIERVRQQAASLRAALREAGAGTAYPVLLEHGIESIEALQDVDPALLTEMFPDPELHAAVAQLSNPL